ncbi:unnamed protein product [Nippostrongylus brasiliensis]|uniref:Uncharacterized protein n=1 Tax=Nippostrongylus brasiliensis TaxID=27835 RepID=A0A0N4XSP3_NIPBR|nr:unnamed protein product [Nippostrongylus brasiliensis]
MRTPVLIHCAIIPSAETVLAIIANDCGEYWPFWLSLHQVWSRSTSHPQLNLGLSA